MRFGPRSGRTGRIVRWGTCRERSAPDTKDQGLMTRDQREIEALLARRIGLDPVTVGPHIVLLAARRRMAELGLDDLGVYASRLGQSEPEQQALHRGGGRPGELVLSGRAAVRLAGGPCARAVGGRPVPCAAAGPEPGVRRGRGAVLDRDHATGRSACRPVDSGSMRSTSVRGGWPSPSMESIRPTPSGAASWAAGRSTSASMLRATR